MMQALPSPLLRVQFKHWAASQVPDIVTGLVLAYVSVAHGHASGTTEAVVMRDDTKQLMSVDVGHLTGIGWRREIEIS